MAAVPAHHAFFSWLFLEWKRHGLRTMPKDVVEKERTAHHAKKCHENGSECASCQILHKKPVANSPVLFSYFFLQNFAESDTLCWRIVSNEEATKFHDMLKVEFIMLCIRCDVTFLNITCMYSVSVVLFFQTNRDLKNHFILCVYVTLDEFKFFAEVWATVKSGQQVGYTKSLKHRTPTKPKINTKLHQETESSTWCRNFFETAVFNETYYNLCCPRFIQQTQNSLIFVCSELSDNNWKIICNDNTSDDR